MADTPSPTEHMNKAAKVDAAGSGTAHTTPPPTANTAENKAKEEEKKKQQADLTATYAAASAEDRYRPIRQGDTMSGWSILENFLEWVLALSGYKDYSVEDLAMRNDISLLGYAGLEDDPSKNMNSMFDKYIEAQPEDSPIKQAIKGTGDLAPKTRTDILKGLENAKSILDIIAKVESSHDLNVVNDYRLRFKTLKGNRNINSPAINNMPVFENTSVREVLAWQQRYWQEQRDYKDAHPNETAVISTAAGKYQFIRGTLKSMVDAGYISMDDNFDLNTQTRAALGLLKQTIDANRNASPAIILQKLRGQWEGLDKVADNQLLTAVNEFKNSEIYNSFPSPSG